VERAAPPSDGDLRLVHLGQSLLVLRLVQSNLSYLAKFSLANAIGVGDPGSEAFSIYAKSPCVHSARSITSAIPQDELHE
jgi:hypothetical protein